MASNAAYNIIQKEKQNIKKKSYKPHLSIVCLIDNESGGALVYGDDKKQIMIPLPIIGHLIKKHRVLCQMD